MAFSCHDVQPALDDARLEGKHDLLKVVEMALKGIGERL